MTVTRVHADDEGEFQFEEVDIDLRAQTCGFMSPPVEATHVLEVTVSDGQTHAFTAGAVLLMEDTTGRGHLSKEISDSGMKSLFITQD